MENTDKNRKKRWLLLVLLLLLLLLLLGGLFCRKKPQTNTAPAPESSVSTPAGGGTVSLTYSDAAGIDLTAGQVTLLFANPEKSGWTPRSAWSSGSVRRHDPTCWPPAGRSPSCRFWTVPKKT